MILASTAVVPPDITRCIRH